MGKSAKLHKRPQKKKVTSSSTSHAKSQSNPVAPAPQPQLVKARANKARKLKSKTSSNETEGHVLGGADYVTLMMGGRAKAREEALKLPVSWLKCYQSGGRVWTSLIDMDWHGPHFFHRTNFGGDSGSGP